MCIGVGICPRTLTSNDWKSFEYRWQVWSIVCTLFGHVEAVLLKVRWHRGLIALHIAPCTPTLLTPFTHASRNGGWVPLSPTRSTPHTHKPTLHRTSPHQACRIGRAMSVWTFRWVRPRVLVLGPGSYLACWACTEGGCQTFCVRTQPPLGDQFLDIPKHYSVLQRAQRSGVVRGVVMGREVVCGVCAQHR